MIEIRYVECHSPQYHTAVQTFAATFRAGCGLIIKFAFAMWKHFQKRIQFIPPFFRSVYFVTAMLFVVWMCFFDENNVFTQYRRHAELSDLLEKKRYYLEQIAKTDKEYLELTTNPATQEKFAREHYRMKRDNEDVFVIVEEK
jgi:hypothetical protein